jgi:copper chaperone
MSCNHCKMAIEKAVKSLGGVHGVNVDMNSKEVKVSYDSTDVKEEDIKQAIEDAGYTAE